MSEGSLSPSKPDILTRRTTANWDNLEFRLGNVSGDNDVSQAANGNSPFLGSTTSDIADGSGTAVYLPFQVGGIINVECGDNVTAGALCTSNGNGQAVDGGPGNYVFGEALGAYVSGEVGAFLWAPSQLAIP